MGRDNQVILHTQLARRMAAPFVTFASLFLAASSLAVYSPHDYVQITYAPAVFSKTTIIGEEVFHTTIKSSGVAVKAPPPADAVRFSYRYIATDRSTGEEVVLNPLKTLTVEPFPQQQGEAYEATNVVSLQFPAGSAAGDYTVSEEIINIEMKDSGADWQDAPKPSKPIPPVQPSAPTKPSEPTKPSAPTQPSAPTKPSRPEGDGVGTKPSRPPEPTRPSEPTQPPEPTKPSEPARPSEPTRPSEPLAPPGPRRIIGTVTYVPSVTTEPGFKPVSFPKPAPASILAVSTLKITPATVEGGTLSVGTVALTRSAPAGGQVVQLSFTPRDLYTNAALLLPDSVTVKAGRIGGTFNILTNKTDRTIKATISATIQKSKATSVLTINPAPLTVSTLIMSPDSVLGGAIAVGKVRLSDVPKNRSEVVQLSATPSGLVSLPANVVVRGGTIGSFSVVTNAVTSPVDVLVTATMGSSRKTASLRVNPPPVTLSTLTVAPSSVMSGATAVGTVTLTKPAPSGGQVVTLAATPRDSLSFPEKITIKSGEISGTFNVSTSKTDSPVRATILATIQYNSQKSVQLTINPVPGPCSYGCRPEQYVGGWSGPSWVPAKCSRNEVKQPWLTCPVTTQTYRCGFWNRSTCTTQVSAICCKPK